MNLKQKWEKRSIEARDYPIRSGELYGDIIVTIVFSVFAGMILNESIRLEFNHMVLGLLLSATFIGMAVFNLFEWTVPTVRSYERNYGPSLYGTNWKKRRDERKRVKKEKC